MVKRTDFTESDDYHLTKFIAQVKPDNSGRLGNNLYIFLEKSADQRPWAKRHSWQSWRERYKKNQGWFNHQIKRYQKKLRESASETEVREELYAELFGISEEGGDESDVHETLSSSEDAIYPSMENITQPGTLNEESALFSSGRKSTATSPTTALQLTPPSYVKPKRIVLPRDDDSNFFCTPSPSPSLPNSTAKGKLPILLQGPYRSSLKRSRAAFGNVTNDQSWPPKRRKKIAEDIDVSSDVEISDSRGMAAVTKTSVSAPLSASGCANGLSRRPPAQTNATASSSKEPPSSDTKMAPECEPPDAAPLPRATKDTKSFLVSPEKHHRRVEGSSPRNSVPSKYMRRLITSPDDRANHLARLSSVDTDPFIASNSHDMPPRRIDLRDSLNLTRRNCNIGSHTSASSTTRHSIPFILLPEDQEIVKQASLQKVMAVIAKHYGFDVDVAMKAFLATKSIEKTKLVLQLGQEAADSATSALLIELANQAEDDDDIDSSGDEERQSYSSPTRNNRNTMNFGHQKAKRSSDSCKGIHPIFNIKLEPFGKEMDQDTLSEYSPPHVSRAGQFMRLVKQGRKEEALDQERQRASSTFVAQTQAQAHDEDQRQQSLSLLPNSSPTSNYSQEPMDIDSRNEDNFHLPVLAPHKDTIQLQPSDDISSPIDYYRQIFFRRISEGQSTVKVEDDPAVLRLAQEHRDLVMNVTEENVDALRRFEQKNSQDLLKLLSLHWVRKKIADMQ